MPNFKRELKCPNHLVENWCLMQKKQKKRKNVLHLNIGQPDLKPPDYMAIEKLNNLELNKLEYSHSAGIIEYRKKL